MLLMPTSGETSSPGWEGLPRPAGSFVFLRWSMGKFFFMSQGQEWAFLPPTFSFFSSTLEKERQSLYVSSACAGFSPHVTLEFSAPL